MEGRQGKNARMDRLEEVVDDGWYGQGSEPEPEWEWLSYSLTFTEAVPRIYGGEYDDLVDEVLMAISHDSPRPGERFFRAIDWSGFGQLVTESERELGSNRVRVRVRMLTIWDDVDDLFWDSREEDAEGGAPPDDL
jgi:hypothetical protein